VFTVEDASRRHFGSPLRRQLRVSISFGEKGCKGMEVKGDVVVQVVVVVVSRHRLLPATAPPR
jgi:hypothetical protein